MEIILDRITGTYDSVKRKIVFQNGMIASADVGFLLDEVKGTMVWDPVIAPECEDYVSGVYSGPASIHAKNIVQPDPYTDAVLLIDVQTRRKKRYAGLELRNQFSLCKRQCYQTHIPEIAVCFLSGSQYATEAVSFKVDFPQSTVGAQTQLSYLIISHGLRIADRFKTIQQDICKLDKKITGDNLRSLSKNDQLALTELYGAGYESYKAGSVAYITQCKQIPVYLADYQNCTQELPVSLYRNGSGLLFMNPFTLILTNYPTVLPCSPLMPPKFKIRDAWYCAQPDIQRCEEPTVLNSSVTPFQPLGSLVKGLDADIYTQKQKDEHNFFRLASSAREAFQSRGVVSILDNYDRDDPRMSRLPILSPYETELIQQGTVAFLSPVIAFFGGWWPILFWVVFAFVVLKFLAGCCTRVVITYRKRGVGPWLILSLWSTLFAIFTIPKDLFKSINGKIEDAVRDFSKRQDQLDNVLIRPHGGSKGGGEGGGSGGGGGGSGNAGTAVHLSVEHRELENSPIKSTKTTATATASTNTYEDCPQLYPLTKEFDKNEENKEDFEFEPRTKKSYSPTLSPSAPKRIRGFDGNIRGFDGTFYTD